MIRYLAPFEKEQARPLWEQAFPEDDQIFLDYYAKTTLPGNRLLAEEENGQVIGMVHRNPYQVQSGNRIWNSEYIVGVATDRSRRHQGIMRRLLTRALTDAAREGLPFVYLMPASESIYRPFGFAAVHAQPAWKLTEKAYRRFLHSLSPLRLEPLRPDDGAQAAEAAAWANRSLAGRYGCFVRQTPGHLAQIQEELAMDAGATVIARSPADGKIRLMFSQIREQDGTAAYVRISGLIEPSVFPAPAVGAAAAPEIPPADRESHSPASAVSAEYLLRPFRLKTTPLIMARPADLGAFLEMFSAHVPASFSLQLLVTDPVCPNSPGRWLWQFHRGKARAWKHGATGAVNQAGEAGQPNPKPIFAVTETDCSASPVTVSADALTLWLFQAAPLAFLIQKGAIRCTPCQAELMEQIAPFHGFWADDTV